MTIDVFQTFLKNCRNFVSNMRRGDIPRNIQKLMLKSYIQGYIKDQYIIHFQDYHITELIS